MKTKKLKIMVVMGDRSSEHEVSLLSGQEVVKNLDRKKYIVKPVVISKDGKGLDQIFKTKNVDVVFIATHGPQGEDGTIQGMLELSGLKYTGSGVLASAIGMDKITFRKIMSLEKILTPKYVVVKKGENFKHIHKILKGAPYFVKPYGKSLSVGTSVVKKQKDLGRALKLAHKYSKLALVDEYIKGVEVNCNVLGNDKVFALPLNIGDEKSETKINKKLTAKVQNAAINIYKAVGASGFCEVKFILKDDKNLYCLKINTNPELGKESRSVKAAINYGIQYPELLDKIIYSSIGN